jgi:hypothetical protein
MNPNVMHFVGTELCTKNIWTHGYSTSQTGGKNHSSPLLAFANDSHQDHCDILSSTLKADWMKEVNKVKENTNDPFKWKVCSKIQEMDATVGMGLPTTSAYRYCWQNEHLDNNNSIEQYFACDSLGICVRICNASAHHFYGWSFVHRTSLLCVRIDGNDVLVKNVASDADDFILSAWGQAGGNAEATVNEGTRRRGARFL